MMLYNRGRFEIFDVLWVLCPGLFCDPRKVEIRIESFNHSDLIWINYTIGKYEKLYFVIPLGKIH